MSRPVKYDASVQMLPHLAEHIGRIIPSLNGRCIAVSESEIFTKDNLPTLPLGMVALGNIAYQAKGNSNGDPSPTETIILQLYFAPERLARGSGEISPFFAHYDYQTIQDQLIAGLRGYYSPRGGRYSVVSLDIEAEDFAVTLAFKLTHEYRWCDQSDDLPGDGHPLTYGRVTARPNHPVLCSCAPNLDLVCPKCKEASFTP